MDKIINKIYNRIIKEGKNIKPEDLDPKLKKFIEDKYGPMDDRDFFSDDLDTYFKTDTDYESEGGGISHNIIRLPSFNELAIQLKKTRDLANELVRGEVVRDDEILRGIYDQQKDVFNKFRTHLRKEYPAFYNQLKQQLTEDEIDEMSTSGAAGSYLTPYAFKRPKNKQKPIPENSNESPSLKAKIAADDFMYQYRKALRIVNGNFGKEAAEEFKNIIKLKISQLKESVNEGINLDSYGYKLVPKDKAGNYVQKGSKLDVVNLFEDQKEYQNKRIAAFDSIEQELNDIYKMLSNAKNETSDYYNDNPSSYAVVKPTDLVLDYIKDIKDLLKGE